MMQLRRLLIVLGSVAVLLVATMALVGADPAQRPGFYPKATVPLKFSHKAHAQRNIACERCHAEAKESLYTADRLLPPEKVCASCHETVTRKAAGQTLEPKCVYCHTGVDFAKDASPLRVTYPAANLIMNHKKHADAGIKCIACHTGQTDIATVGTGSLPSEELCLSCHNTDRNTRGCMLCHPADSGGTLRKAPQPRRGLLDHQDRWLVRHATVARYEKPACDACHKPNECFDCHGGLVKPQQVHPGDFKLTHAAEAKKDPQRCTACHQQSRDCRLCHERLGMGEKSGAVARSAQIHPPGWGSCSLNASHHAYQAKRSIGNCASCHRESQCIRCHRPGGECGGLLSPHRHMSRGQLNDMKQRNPDMCRKCHGNSTP